MNKKQIHYSQQGFTLIELLVVVSILAAMAGIAVSAVGGYEQQAREELAHTEIKRIARAIQKFNSDTGYFPKTGIFSVEPSGLNKSDLGFLFYSPRQQGVNNQRGTEILPWDATRGWNGPYLSYDAIDYMSLNNCNENQKNDELNIFPENVTSSKEANSIIALSDTFESRVVLGKQEQSCFIVKVQSGSSDKSVWVPKLFSGQPYIYETQFKNNLYPDCKKIWCRLYCLIECR
jgi:prepilin-type N-terminal cleavage/methylation domain-containing protein